MAPAFRITMKIRLSLVVATTLMMILLLITASTVTSTSTVDDQVVFTNHAHGHTPLTEKLAMIRAETSHAEAERKLGMRMVVTEDDPDAHVEGRVCIINETSHAAGMEDETFCYPRTFKATNVFQAVLYGQHLPKGLHVRMDFATGLREAKLLDGEDNDVQVATDIVLDAANVADKDQAVALVVAEPAVESAPSSSTVQPAPIPVIHRNRALEIELDEVLTLLTGSSTVDVSTSELVVDRIQLLDVYAHDFKDGQALLANATVLDALVTAMLEHASPNVRASVAVIIGSALENNPGAQDLAMAYRRRQTGSGSGSGTVTERDLFQLVLDRMDVEPDRRAADELLFLLSSLVRGNDVATQKLFDSTAVAETPLTRLRLGPMVNVGERTRQKAIHLVTDAVRFMTESGGKDGVGMPANAVEELQPWCDLFRAEAGNASSLLREDAQEALDVVDGVCKGINLTQ